MSTAEDLALIQRVIAGDQAAHRIFMEHTGRITRKCLANVRGRCPWIQAEEADLLQRFTLMLLENDHRVLRSYAGQSRLTTWIYVIATRFFQRQAGKLKREEVALEPGRDQPDEAESAETLQMRKAQIQGVRKVLSALSPQERLMLTMTYEQGLPAHEVGKMMGLTESGVRMKKQRLLKKLAKRLKGLWP